MRLANGIVKLYSSRLPIGAYLAEVDLTRLYFPDYQREAIKPHVKRIGDAWDKEFARPLLISLRDGHLNVFDGRQTSAAALAKTNPEKTLTAFVWDRWTYEREARAFFIFNTVPKGMAGWKNFIADMKAGNQANMLILETLHSIGLTTPIHPAVQYANAADVPQSNVILGVMKKGGLPLVRLFAKVMKNWKVGGVLPETAKRSQFGRGLRDFLSQNQNQERQVLNVLGVLTPDQVMQLSTRMPNKGRIEATQVRQALEQLGGQHGILTIPVGRAGRRAA